MECKFICVSIIKGIRNELIDTLWNVNVNGKEIIRSGTGELIDTLWNVNLSVLSPC